MVRSLCTITGQFASQAATTNLDRTKDGSIGLRNTIVWTAQDPFWKNEANDSVAGARGCGSGSRAGESAAAVHAARVAGLVDGDRGERWKAGLDAGPQPLGEVFG